MGTAALTAAAHPMLGLLIWGALGGYVATWGMALWRPAQARGTLAVAVFTHFAAMVGRGTVIGFLPLTTKTDSFLGAALGAGAVALWAWRPSRLYLGTLMLCTVGPMLAALSFGLDLRWAPPLLRTVWYPLHVPLSFVAFGLWAAALGASVEWWATREREWLGRVEKLGLQGFGLWTAAMIFGGVWGVLAWGAYFMWDPKMVWSVILWFHYAGFVHVKLTPSLAARPWTRPALASWGFALILVAYVGTSFFFGKSTHAF